MSSDQSNYVSIIGSSYVHPIATLIERLEEHDFDRSEAIQVSPVENGYSASLVLLTVVMVESCIRRVQYDEGDGSRYALSFIKDWIKAKLPKAYDQMNLTYLDELFILRDVIAHNHVWEAVVGDDLQLTGDIALVLGGDKKYKENVDAHTRVTNLLSVSVFPTKIGRPEAVAVLKLSVGFLSLLNSLNPRVSVHSQYVKYRGEPVNFGELIASLEM